MQKNTNTQNFLVKARVEFMLKTSEKVPEYDFYWNCVMKEGVEKVFFLTSLRNLDFCGKQSYGQTEI